MLGWEERETNVTRWGLGVWKGTQELPGIEFDFCIFYRRNLGGSDDSFAGNIISLRADSPLSSTVQTPALSTHCGESTFNLNDYLPCLFTAHKFLQFLDPDLGFDLQHLRQNDLLFCVMALNPCLGLFPPPQLSHITMTCLQRLSPSQVPDRGCFPGLQQDHVERAKEAPEAGDPQEQSTVPPFPV